MGHHQPPEPSVPRKELNAQTLRIAFGSTLSMATASLNQTTAPIDVFVRPLLEQQLSMGERVEYTLVTSGEPARTEAFISQAIDTESEARVIKDMEIQANGSGNLRTFPAQMPDRMSVEGLGRVKTPFRGKSVGSQDRFGLRPRSLRSAA